MPPPEGKALMLQRAFAQRLREPTLQLEGEPSSLVARGELPLGKNLSLSGDIGANFENRRATPRANVNLKYEF